MAVHPCPMCKRLIPVGITYCDSCRPEAEARAAAAVERKRKQYNRTYNKRRDPARSGGCYPAPICNRLGIRARQGYPVAAK